MKSVHAIDEMVREYCDKEGNSTGGYLHIVLDDGNTEADHVLWCLREAEKAGDADGVALAEQLLMLDQDERDGVVNGRFKRWG
jgi:hypothetical protein